MEETEKKVLKMSDQFIGAIMMALQKGLIEQCDITELLRGLEIQEESDELFVLNIPSFEIKEDEEEEISA